MTFGSEADEALSLRLIGRALEAGINFLDTANVYSRGRSEEIVLVDRVIEMELLPLCQDQGVGVICYSPLAGGILTGKYRPGEPPPAESRGGRNEGFMRRRGAPHNVERAHQVLAVLTEIPHPPTQAAVAWTLANPVVTSAIIGARNEEQLTTLLEGWGWVLAAGEKARLDEVSALPPLH
jgi:aryl-alcohol dehydrogenase-like predicted oxidoreductase